jgi:hypothetical protein
MLPILAGTLAILCFSEPTTKAAKTVVLVFPIEDRTSKISGEGLGTLNDYLAAQIGKVRGFSIIPQGEIRSKLSSEKAASYKACYDDACQVDLGKELAASKVVATRLRPLGSQCVLALYLYDLARSTSDATATVRSECAEEKLVAAIDEAVRQLEAEPNRGSAARDPADGKAPTEGGGRSAFRPGESVAFRGTRVREVTEKERRTARLPSDSPNGAYVISADAGTPAIEAGIRAGDVITEVGIPARRDSITRIRIDSPEELSRLSARRETLLVKLYRGGASQTVTLKPGIDNAREEAKPDPQSQRAPIQRPDPAK